MSVPFLDLAEQHAGLHDEFVAAFERVLSSSAFIGGPEVLSFEREFADYCETKHVIGVANGTDALALALRAVGVGPGDGVAVPAFTFAATAEAVCHVGATPVFVDIEPHSFALDPQALKVAIEQGPTKIKAVIPVHLYGQIADMDAIAAICTSHGVTVIEDAAQAHGARYRGKRSGGLATVGCFSFYPTKNLGAIGDAGALSTDDDTLAATLRELRDHGQRQKYMHAVIGFNSRLDSVQAAVLRIKLRHLDEWNDRRRQLAKHYGERLASTKGLTLPTTGVAREHVFHLFVIRAQRRDSLRDHLQANGIGCALHYPLALHEQEAFRFAGKSRGSFPVAEQASSEVLALPMYPELSQASVDRVCDAILEWSRTQP